MQQWIFHQIFEVLEVMLKQDGLTEDELHADKTEPNVLNLKFQKGKAVYVQRQEEQDMGMEMSSIEEMLKEAGKTIKGQTVVISGAGNVAIYAVKKAQELGAKVVAMCDSSGYIFDEDGIDLPLIQQIKRN